MMGCSRAILVSISAKDSSSLALDVPRGRAVRFSSSPRALWSVAKSMPGKSFVSQRELKLRVGASKGLRKVRASSPESGDNGPTKTEDVPSWAKPDSGEIPPWARNERPASEEPVPKVQFVVYLLSSAVVAIAAVGSVFEYFYQNPAFGVVYPDSPLYTPLLGFFVIAGLPSAGFLFYKSIQLANKASEEADKEDGVRR